MDSLPLGPMLGVLALTLLFAALLSAVLAADDTLAGQRPGNRREPRPTLDFPAASLLFWLTLARVVIVVLGSAIGIGYGGGQGLWLSALLTALCLLVVVEYLPRRLAQQQAGALIHLANTWLTLSMKLVWPAAWLLDALARVISRPFTAQGGNASPQDAQPSRHLLEELAQDARANKPQLIKGIHALESITVNDILVPRNEVDGIDLDDPIESIAEQLMVSRHTRLPVYHHDINQVERVLNTRQISHLLPRGELTKEALLGACYDAYFVPESTPLQVQLLNFHKQQRRLGVVVDEYGEVLGLVTLEDILEEIVGEFEDEQSIDNPHIQPLPDGRFVVDGAASIRELNKSLGWHLPSDGPKTLNGLVTEALESIPDCAVCLRLGRYRLEILETEDNRASRVLIWYVAPVLRAL
jgi:Mg2+/Co2+ transporter CorB